jgi:cation transporter-like permease
MKLTKVKEWFKKGTTIRIILVIVVQAFLALLFDVFGLGAGSIGTFTFIGYADTFKVASTFIILLYPPLLSSDGGIGVLVSGLGTGLNIGSMKPQILKNTEQYYTLISSVLTIGLFNGLWIGLISYITNLISSGVQRILNPLPFLVIPILSLTFASLISSQLASLLAFFMFKKGLNPDVWVYPTMSTVNNIISTLFYAILIYILQPKNWFAPSGAYQRITAGTYFAIIPVVLYLGFMIYLFVKNIGKKKYRKILQQALSVQTVTLTINSLTGGILSKADRALTNIKGLFLVYPALIDTLGDECTILSNTTSTNLAIGSIEARFDAFKDKDLWTNIVGVGIAGFMLHIIYGILGSILAGDFSNIGLVLVFSLAINILGFLVVESLAFLLIVLSYRKGLDPDNYAVPIIAALSNLVCSSLILLLTLGV